MHTAKIFLLGTLMANVLLVGSYAQAASIGDEKAVENQQQAWRVQDKIQDQKRQDWRVQNKLIDAKRADQRRADAAYDQKRWEQSHDRR